MLNFLNLQPEIFGIDVNDLSLRIVKLRNKRKGFSVASYNEVDMKPNVIHEGVIQDQDSLVASIKIACKSIKGKRLGTTYVIVSLPEEKSFSQVIQMPRMTHEELITAVPLEAENYIPLPIDKVYLDFEVIKTHHEEKQVSNHLDLLINVMPKSIVDSYVTCFKKAGLTPCIMEVESQAIARALMKRGSTMPPVILIDLGNANTSFIIFSGDSIRFTSSISISSAQFTRAIADTLKITVVKAELLKTQQGLIKEKVGKNVILPALEPILDDLANQIKKYIIFYRDHVSHEYFPSDGKIEKIILCGGGANLKGLNDFLFERLKIPVEIGNPFINVVSSDVQKPGLIPTEKALSFTTAMGLALRGVMKKDNRL